MRFRILAATTLMLVALAALPAAPAQDKVEPKQPPIPYPTAHAKPLEAKEEIVAEANDFTQYRVEFNGVKGDRVPAYLYVPKKKGMIGPFPAILLQYGSGGNKTVNYIVEIGKQFAARGFVVLTIDSPNCGERRNKSKDKGGLLGLASTEVMMHYCGDYSRAIDFLAKRREVNPKRIGFVGISWGAITGITFVAYDQRIKAVGSMVGGGNFLGLYSAKAAEKAAREGSKSSDPVYHVARIAPRPLLFINVTKDQMILKSWAVSLHKAAGPGSVVKWVDTDHYFRSVDRAKVCESVIDFMDKHLTQAAAGEKKKAAKDGRLQKLADLAGTWVALDKNGKPTDQVVSVFKVTAAGSAVHETIFPGTPHEMVSVYHLDGKDLIMTHYCAAKNQPRMKADPKSPANKLSFQFIGGANIDPAKDMHMHEGSITWIDADTIEWTWQGWADGKPAAEHRVSMKLRRRK